MTNLHAAINHYHDLCNTGTLAQQSWEVLMPGLRERNLIFGQRPLCTVLRPMFHTADSYRYLTERTALTLSVFRKATAALLTDPKLRAQLFLDQILYHNLTLHQVEAHIGSHVQLDMLDLLQSFPCLH